MTLEHPNDASTSQERRRFRAVVFDMDGLLADSEPVWHQAEHDLAARWGAKWTHADAVAGTGKGIPNTAERIAHAAGRPFSPKDDIAALVDAFLARAASVRPKPGAREIVLRLATRRVPIGLGSSSPLRVVSTVMRAIGLEGAFDAVVTSDDVANVKPAPDIFLVCAARLGVETSACVVLEDSGAGVEAGKRAGMCVCAVPEAIEDAPPIADHVVRSLDEAWPILLALLDER